MKGQTLAREMIECSWLWKKAIENRIEIEYSALIKQNVDWRELVGKHHNLPINLQKAQGGQISDVIENSDGEKLNIW